MATIKMKDKFQPAGDDHPNVTCKKINEEKCILLLLYIYTKALYNTLPPLFF
jgi:hypothetical protein